MKSASLLGTSLGLGSLIVSATTFALMFVGCYLAFLLMHFLTPGDTGDLIFATSVFLASCASLLTLLAYLTTLPIIHWHRLPQTRRRLLLHAFRGAIITATALWIILACAYLILRQLLTSHQDFSPALFQSLLLPSLALAAFTPFLLSAFLCTRRSHSA